MAKLPGALREVRDVLSQVNTRIGGAVLNSADDNPRETYRYGYYYRYGKYFSSSDKYFEEGPHDPGAGCVLSS